MSARPKWLSLLALVMLGGSAVHAEEKRPWSRGFAELDLGFSDFGLFVGGEARLTLAYDSRWIRVGGLARFVGLAEADRRSLPLIELELGPMLEVHLGARVRLGTALVGGAAYYGYVDELVEHRVWLGLVALPTWLAVDVWQGKRGNAVIVSPLLQAGIAFGSTTTLLWDASLALGYRW